MIINIRLKLIYKLLSSYSQKAFIKIIALYQTFLKKNQEFYSKKKTLSSLQQNILFLLDVLTLFFSLLISATLFESEFSEYSSGFLIKNMTVFMLTTLAVFLGFNVYRSEKIYKNFHPFIPSLFLYVLIGTILYYPFMLLLGQLEHFSLWTPISNIFVSIFFLFISRLIVIYIKIQYATSKDLQKTQKPLKVLLVGTLNEIDIFFKSLEYKNYQHLDPIAIVTTNTLDFGRYINNIPIIGAIDSLNDLINSNKITPSFQYIFIIGAFLPQKTIYKLIQIAQESHIPVLTLMRSYSSQKKLLDTTP